MGEADNGLFGDPGEEVPPPVILEVHTGVVTKVGVAPYGMGVALVRGVMLLVESCILGS